MSHLSVGRDFFPMPRFLNQKQCLSTYVSLLLLAFSFSWATLAWASLAWRLTGLSKKPTMAGSLSREARTCSKEKDHSTSETSDSVSGLWSQLEVSELSGVEGVSLGDSSSSPPEAAAAAALAAAAVFKGLLGSCSLRPTSSIFSSRLVTCATAR